MAVARRVERAYKKRGREARNLRYGCTAGAPWIRNGAASSLPGASQEEDTRDPEIDHRWNPGRTRRTWRTR